MAKRLPPTVVLASRMKIPLPVAVRPMIGLAAELSYAFCSVVCALTAAHVPPVIIPP